MNAVEFLIKEHDKVKKMLKDINDKSHRFETKKSLFNHLADELIRHEKMEETIWYPQLKKDTTLYDEIKHLIKEEKEAEKLIKAIKDISAEDEWEVKFLKFKNAVEHHAKEEETELFPLVKKHYDPAMLEKIGKEMREFKESYQSETT